MLALARGSSVIEISQDPTMSEVERLAAKAASCRANVLLQGESGVGKAYIARSIHEASAMAARRFFSLFCFPESYVGPECLSLRERLRDLDCRRGTVYLRGVDLLDGVSQRELLAYLDDRDGEIEASGRSSKRFGRLIFSSQKNLKLESEVGRYLMQLYLRVSVVTIEVPPLRKRSRDIVNLAKHFLSVYADRECKDIRGLSPDAAYLLRRRAWEGNIHELENAMNQAVVMADNGVVVSAGMLKGVLAQGYG
jgi:two-component system response regulator HydG